MKKMGAKAVVVALAGVLAIGGAVGGTIAWLTDTTEQVTNTFTVGNVTIDLTETEDGDGQHNYKMIPGSKIDKNPVVQVAAGSEACWLFVQVTEDLGSWEAPGVAFENYLTYQVDDSKGWKLLTSEAGGDVYYIQVSAADAKEGISYQVLKDNAVIVKSTVTKDDMDKLVGDGKELPTLSFKAYAIQQENIGDTAADAWQQIKSPSYQ